jgi:hypothetical protein
MTIARAVIEPTDRAAAARAARRRYADERVAAVLRSRGWVCLSPLDVVSMRVETDAVGVEHLFVHGIERTPADADGRRP